jgi:type IV secretory pathway VirJ component
MRNSPSLLGALLIAALAAASANAGATATAVDRGPVRHLEFPPMGPIEVYLPDHVDAKTDVVLFASGAGGWDAHAADVATQIQGTGRIVAGFSTPEYLKRIDASGLKCANPPQDLVSLSQFVQRELGILDYRTPMLVGDSSGASLAYVVAAQTPINAFTGAIAIGFCPELAMNMPLCRRGALRKLVIKGDGNRLQSVDRLVAPLEVLEGTNDERCKTDDVAAFVQRTGNAHLTPPHAGGAVQGETWLAQFNAAFATLAALRPVEGASKSADLAGLPLIERPIESTSTTLVVMLSGDGGWSTLTEKVTVELNGSGYPVVGWNMLKYFWNAKPPEQAAQDLATIMRYFSDAWHTQDVILAGYSMGADVLPGIVNRLPPAEQRRVRSVVLMAPERATDYEFHMSGWLKHVPKDALPIAPEVENMPADIPITCIYGDEEADRSLCTQVDAGRRGLTLKELPGAHHFDGDYEALARLVR